MKWINVLTLTASSLAIAAGGGYHVLSSIKVGGEGGWDYVTVDSGARRLYVSHATHIAVIDLDSEKVVGDIPDTQGVHGIAIAPELNRGFTSNGRANTVTIVDLKTLKALGSVKTGDNPDSIRYEPVSGRVFTFNGRSKDSTVFDAKTGKVLQTIPLSGKPEFAVADEKGRIYVNNEDTSEIIEIDATKLAVSRKYSIKPCQAPSGLAMNTKGRRLFSVCENRLMAISDPDSQKVITTLPIGEGSDGAGFDSSRGLAFSSNGDGTLTVVHEVSGKWEVMENDRTEPGARTMAVDEKTHRIYLPTATLGPAPTATAQAARPRPVPLPGTFKVLVMGN